MNTEPIAFTNHFRERVMEVSLPNGLTLYSESDVSHLKETWGKNVLEWHTPYKCIADFSSLDLEQNCTASFVRAIKHLRSFFMTDLVVCCGSEAQRDLFRSAGLPGKLTLTSEEMRSLAGMTRSRGTASHSRTMNENKMRFSNHFETGVMELQFSDPVRMESDEDVDELLESLESNILKWHRAYTLLVDADCIEDTPTSRTALNRASCLARGFFCQAIHGFGQNPKNFSFPIHPTKHKALELCQEALHAAAAKIKTSSVCNKEATN